MKEKHSFQIWWESIVGGGKSDDTSEYEKGYLQGLKEATELEDNLEGGKSDKIDPEIMNKYYNKKDREIIGLDTPKGE